MLSYSLLKALAPTLGFLLRVESGIVKTGLIGSDMQVCTPGCRIDSDDAFGSIWDQQIWNYTVATVVLQVNIPAGITHTASVIEPTPRIIAWQEASRSIEGQHNFRHKVIVVSGTQTWDTVYGRAYTWPTSELRLEKYTAYSTFEAPINHAGSRSCTTTSSVYTRPTDKLWVTLQGTDEAWGSTQIGTPNRSPYTDRVIGTWSSFRPIPSSLFTTHPELAKCTTATMAHSVMMKVALLARTKTVTKYEP